MYLEYVFAGVVCGLYLLFHFLSYYFTGESPKTAKTLMFDVCVIGASVVGGRVLMDILHPSNVKLPVLGISPDDL